MQKFNDLFDKAKLENLIIQFIEQDYSEDTTAEKYDERLSKSYNKLYQTLECMYRQTDVEDNRLHDIITNFAQEQARAYLEIGVILGARMYKNMKQGYRNCLKLSIENILKNGYDSNISNEDKKLLTELFLTRTDNAIEAAIKEDKDYQTVNNIVHQQIKELNKLTLTDEAWSLIDKILSASNDRGAEYGRVTYCQGFIDATKLL